jgi:hypothetical protein
MIIFSYIWTKSAATKRIKEINSKSKEILLTTFEDYYSHYFIEFESSKPEPIVDIDFNDFSDLNFALYKDVNIHSMEIYDNGHYISGFEIYYVVDGDVTKYIMHHRIKRQN